MKALEKIDLETATVILSERAFSWFENLVRSLPNILIAIIIFIMFLFIASFMRKLSSKLLSKLSYSVSVINLSKTTVYYCTLFIGLFICLEILNLEKTVTSILAGAGVIGLALGFAFQEIASNFIAGIIIAMREPYRIDDIIEIQGFQGIVTEINLRTTNITTFAGLEVIIPNKTMFTEPLTNYTSTPTRRMDLKVGISYAENLDKVEEVTLKAVETISNRDESKEPEFYYEEFGDSSINFTVRVWVKYPNNQAYILSRHEAVKNIKRAYDSNGITIPFPIRTLDFGIKGGKQLKEML